MEAKVRQESRYGTHIAFSGVEFVKYEWRAVPESVTPEQRAGQSSLLEFRDASAVEPEKSAGPKTRKPAGPKSEDVAPEA